MSKSKIVIVVRSGMAQSVYSTDREASVEVIDLDTLNRTALHARTRRLREVAEDKSFHMIQ